MKSEQKKVKAEIIQGINSYIHSNKQKPYLIAIDGMCASGKTTLAAEIKEECPETEIIHMDDFFLRPEQRTRERLQEPGGNIDYERFWNEVLRPLQSSGKCTYRIYDCKTQTFIGEKTLKQPRVVLIEGAYSRHPYFRHPYDAEYFLSIDKTEQRERIRKRNGEGMLKRFMEEWIPMENQYFETYGIR